MTGKCNPSPLLLVHFQQLASIHQFHDSRTKHYPLKGRGESAEAVGGGGCEFLVDFLSREGVISFTLSFSLVFYLPKFSQKKTIPLHLDQPHLPRRVEEGEGLYWLENILSPL